MKKLLGTVLTLGLAAVTLASCGGKEEETTTITVGMECAYAPFNWTETTKTDTNYPISNLSGSYAEGYDVQMAKKIADDLGLTLEVKALEWDALIPSLQNGEIDMIIAGMSPTDERKKQIDFTDAYYTSEEVILLKKDSKYATATSLDDFKDATVAGQLGTLYADLVDQVVAKGGKAGTNLDTVPALVQQIKSDVIDGTIVELPVATGLCAQDSSLSYVQFAEGKGFEVSPEDVMVSIGVRKGYELEDKINAALAKISTETRTEMMAQAVSDAA